MKSPQIKYYTGRKCPNGFSGFSSQYLVAKGRHWYVYTEARGLIRETLPRSIKRNWSQNISNGEWIEVSKKILNENSCF